MIFIFSPALRFQSTSSVWRTTRCTGSACSAYRPISIHVLRVEDDRPADEAAAAPEPISIHVLRVEDDKVAEPVVRAVCDFNPRPPCGGRRQRIGGRYGAGISIHVLRVEDDSKVSKITPRNDLFQSTSSVWRTTAKTEKNLYLHSYNIAICIDLQSHQSAHATVCTTNPKQSPQKPVRSIRLCGDRPMFARPLSPDGALRKSERHPAGRRGELRCVQPCFDNGCPAGKSAGCPLPGRSIWPVQP